MKKRAFAYVRDTAEDEFSKRVFAYARTSKEDKDEPTWSITTQLKRIEERVARDDSLVLAGTWEDRDQSGALDFEDAFPGVEIEDA
jgi:hypothetical protein